MSTVSYNIFNVENFPESDQINVSGSQESFLEDWGEEAPDSYLLYQREISLLNTKVYEIVFEYLLRRNGRAKGNQFNHFIARDKLTGYLLQKKNVFLIKGKKDIAQNAAKEMNRLRTDLQLDKPKISLDELSDRINNYQGANFSVDKASSAHVNSQALNGNQIELDPMFERALAEGGLKYVRFWHEFQGTMYHVGLTVDYSVVLLGSNEIPESTQIAIVMNLKERLLDTAII